MDLENLKQPTSKEPRVKHGDWLQIPGGQSVRIASNPHAMNDGEKWWALIDPPAGGRSRVIFFSEDDVWL